MTNKPLHLLTLLGSLSTNVCIASSITETGTELHLSARQVLASDLAEHQDHLHADSAFCGRAQLIAEWKSIGLRVKEIKISLMTGKIPDDMNKFLLEIEDMESKTKSISLQLAKLDERIARTVSALKAKVEAFHSSVAELELWTKKIEDDEPQRQKISADLKHINELVLAGTPPSTFARLLAQHTSTLDERGEDIKIVKGILQIKAKEIAEIIKLQQDLERME